MDAATNIHSAYDLKPPTFNAKLTEVGRGTPMGELLRRYWHPVGMTADAGATRDRRGKNGHGHLGRADPTRADAECCGGARRR